MTASKPHSELVAIIREGIEAESGMYTEQESAEAALESLVEQYERLTQRPEWVTCDYQPEKREDDPGGRSCTEAINFYATELAGLEEQFEALNTAAREWIEMCDRDDNPAYPAATLQEVDRLQKALRDAVSFPASSPNDESRPEGRPS